MTFCSQKFMFDVAFLFSRRGGFPLRLRLTSASQDEIVAEQINFLFSPRRHSHVRLAKSIAQLRNTSKSVAHCAITPGSLRNGTYGYKSLRTARG
jgi:hypothetical protein